MVYFNDLDECVKRAVSKINSETYQVIWIAGLDEGTLGNQVGVNEMRDRYLSRILESLNFPSDSQELHKAIGAFYLENILMHGLRKTAAGVEINLKNEMMQAEQNLIKMFKNSIEPINQVAIDAITMNTIKNKELYKEVFTEMQSELKNKLNQSEQDNVNDHEELSSSKKNKP